VRYPERPFGDALFRATTAVQTKTDQRYRISGIHSSGKGLICRGEISGFETAYSTLHRISAGQVVMSKLQAWKGAVALVDEAFDGTYVSPEFPVFDINMEEHDPRYLSHLVAWPELWGRLTLRGSTMRKRTTPEAFLATTVPLPNLREQRRVAAKLDMAMNKIAEANRLRKAAQTSCEALRESLITHDSSQVMRTVGSFMELKRRAVRIEPNADYREVGIRSFGKGVFHKPTIIGRDLGGKKIFSIEPGDLLFSSVFAWEGAVARATDADRGRVGSHRFRTYIVDDTVADADYLRFFFLSTPGLEVLRRCSRGVAGRNKTLGIKVFKETQIPLPSLPKQRRIARMLLTMEQISLRFYVEYEQRVEACRASLLNAAFAGRL
jgi:type I restriction enzyme, S subunit